MNRFLGITLIVLALGLGIAPHYTDCLSQGNTVTLANGKTQPMKCHWTAQAEIAAAVPIAGLGIILATKRRQTNLMSLGVMGVALGIVPIVLATNLIGTCALATHICNTTMKPIIMSLGGLVGVVSLGVVINGWRNRKLLE
ncbi:MAG: DUF4418 family protein [Dehalogenimonas sp.]